ncbi:MAG: hypothetical protein LBO69_09130 [Ignavibacteria bacterium]|nr:hypothetical protein [Ignavibacteria bacterium]
MTLISDTNFIVVDVETTGSHASYNKITDIACITVNNFEIIDTFSSLVNPHQPIPPYIQKMTGIYDLMVMNAPEASEVFAVVRNILLQDNSCFVAHNVPFDWRFVSEAINSAGLSAVDVPTLCTLKLGNRLIPKNIKKNVGSLADYFNIPIVNRHRAYDDAFATANFFIEMLLMLQDRFDIVTLEDLLDFQNRDIRRYKELDTKIFDKLRLYQKQAPHSNGILTFIGKSGKVLHISRSNDIAEHISSFIEETDEVSKKIRSVLKKFVRLEWLETTSELEAYILEYRKIKLLQPEYNSIKYLDLFNADDIQVNAYSQQLLVKNLSMVVLYPNSPKEKLIDVIFIHKGRYVSTTTIGTKANLNSIFDCIHDTFYADDEEVEFDINEIRILNYWLYKNTSLIKKHLYDEQDELLFGETIEQSIRTFYAKDSNANAENDMYIGNFIYG